MLLFSHSTLAILVYLFDFFYAVLQVGPNAEVVETYHALFTIAWLLIGCTLIIIFIFGYLLYEYIKKRPSREEIADSSHEINF